jgi:acyl-CoA synthetase (AMP-forming)/AMP-acid ligase II
VCVIFFLSQRAPSLRTQFGEKVCAWIKKKDNAEARAVTAENIQAFCKEKIAHYKVRMPVVVVILMVIVIVIIVAGARFPSTFCSRRSSR